MCHGPKGSVPLSQLVRAVTGSEEKTLYRKNLKNVVYVIGDVAGEIEAPVYAILKMRQGDRRPVESRTAPGSKSWLPGSPGARKSWG